MFFLLIIPFVPRDCFSTPSSIFLAPLTILVVVVCLSDKNSATTKKTKVFLGKIHEKNGVPSCCVCFLLRAFFSCGIGTMQFPRRKMSTVVTLFLTAILSCESTTVFWQNLCVCHQNKRNEAKVKEEKEFKRRRKKKQKTRALFSWGKCHPIHLLLEYEE